jgi:TATA-box binding protein (TBP) (component of TFIID and TFIIIB)
MATVQTSAQPHQAGTQTHYLTRTDGETTVHSVELQGHFLTQNLEARCSRLVEEPTSVLLSFRSGAFTLTGFLTHEEADLLSRALCNAAADARKQIQAHQVEEVPA